MSGKLLLLGLGNPGRRYEGTRHNVGFDLIDLLAIRLGVGLNKPFFGRYRVVDAGYLLCKPLTYMNRSGEILPTLHKRYSIDVVCAVVDNMDLAPGDIRMKTRGSASTHNGLRSIERVIDSTDFPRIYIGIGRPPTDVGIIEHVLGRADGTDSEAIAGAVSRLAEVLVESAGRTIEQLATAVNELRRPKADVTS